MACFAFYGIFWVREIRYPFFVFISNSVEIRTFYFLLLRCSSLILDCYNFWTVNFSFKHLMEFTVIDTNLIRSNRDVTESSVNRPDNGNDSDTNRVADFREIVDLDLSCSSEYSIRNYNWIFFIIIIVIAFFFFNLIIQRITLVNYINHFL